MELPVTYTQGDRAYSLLRGGTSIINYSNCEYLEDDIVWFKSEGYQIVEFDGHSISTESDLLKQLQDSQCGDGMHSLNLDSFNDSLINMELSGKGLIVVFRHIEPLLKNTELLIVLNILDRYSRFSLLNGTRVLTLVQADDQHVNIARIGVRRAIWNPREQSYANRKVDPKKIRNYNID